MANSTRAATPAQNNRSVSVTFDSSSTGATSATTLRAPASKVTGLFTGTFTTVKILTWQLQGSLNESADWVNLSVLTTSSGVGNYLTSTAVHIVDRVRASVTVNDTTGNLTFYVADGKT